MVLKDKVLPSKFCSQIEQILKGLLCEMNAIILDLFKMCAFQFS